MSIEPVPDSRYKRLSILIPEKRRPMTWFAHHIAANGRMHRGIIESSYIVTVDSVQRAAELHRLNMMTYVGKLCGENISSIVRLSWSPIVNEGKRRGSIIRIVAIKEDEGSDDRPFGLVVGCDTTLIRSSSLVRWNVKVHASVAIFKVLVLHLDTGRALLRTIKIVTDIDVSRSDAIRAHFRIKLWQDLDSFVRQKPEELLFGNALKNCFFIAT